MRRGSRAWRRLVLDCRAAATQAADRGDPWICPRCGQVLLPRHQPTDLGHAEDVALGGRTEDGVRLEHERCNRAAGAALGNRLRAEAISALEL